MKSPSPPRIPPFSSTFQLCLEPVVGKIGWLSVERTIPSCSWLWVPGGSPKSEVSSDDDRMSYVVRAIEYPVKRRVRRAPGTGNPKRTDPPIRRRCPDRKEKKRSRALKSEIVPV